MSVTSVNIARVSENLRAFNLLATIRSSQVSLFRTQNQLATGLKFQAPSEEPVAAAGAAALDLRLANLEQVRDNVRDSNAALLAGESAMQDAIDIVRDGLEIASQAAGDTLSRDERNALAVVVDAMIDQMIAIGNRRHLDMYLFSGQQGQQPFVQINNGVRFHGDAARRHAIVETDFTRGAFTFPGEEFFGAVSSGVRGSIDLDPALTAETRISDLRGTTGAGVRLGRLTVSDGAQQVEIDVRGAATVGDLIDKLNAEMPAALRASLGSKGIVLSALPGVAATTNISVADVGANQGASDLGIAVTGAGPALNGADLDPVLTPRTPLSALRGGADFALTGGIAIRNGVESATLDFAGALTVEDILNRFNQSDMGIHAEIDDNGRTLNVRNLVSGAALFIGEDNGSAAANLGIRTMNADTKLTALNNGLGMETVPGGADARITTADGTVTEVDLDGLQTLQDVINRFNAAGGGNFTASLATQGNGLIITDNTSGAATLRIERANSSPAIDGLGLDVSATGNRLVGRDVNPQRVDSTFTALMEVRGGLLADDGQAITMAGTRLEAILKQMQEHQGRMAAQAQNMVERESRIENEVSAARVLLSDIRDVDIAEAVVRFQQLQTALQANLATSSRILNLSLIDFLR
ncbi:MAG: hypothetical protein IH986_07435 [Planctomycetes bacterium]|nr:hypothetical protein [Planctomycetota bacterium]